MNGPEPFDTVTHARVRAAQGDVRGARRILSRILHARPDDLDAHALLAALDGRTHREAAPEAATDVDAPVAARPEDLAARFKTALGRRGAVDGPGTRLRSLLRRIESVRRTPDDGGRP